jgi:predicted acetyltransferase
MPVEIRNYLEGFADRKAALRALFDMDETAFGESSSDEDLDSPIFGVVDDDRTFTAWDGDQIVGTSANFTLDTSVPGGGSLPTAGVTFIGVRPTHRRRGVMTQMLENLHADGIKRNEPIATLWAADAAIYGRFGYGVATERLNIEIQHHHRNLVNAPDDPSIRIRMVETATDYEYVAPIYEQVRNVRGGVPAMDEKWNARATWDPPQHREGASRVQTVIAEDDAGVRGFLRYALKPDWSGGYAHGTVNIYRLMSADSAAHAALWRYCLSIDLMGKTSWWNAPADDPIQTWLEHPREAKRQINDAMWLRILDLPTTLTARTYSSEFDVTMAVTDTRYEQNSGTWRLSGGPKGTTCERASSSPDFSVDIKTLGAISLGGPTLTSHATAGWVEEHTTGSVMATSAAFAAPLAPYCPFVF